jgi:hypothetical protein
LDAIASGANYGRSGSSYRTGFHHSQLHLKPTISLFESSLGYALALRISDTLVIVHIPIFHEPQLPIARASLLELLFPFIALRGTIPKMA